MANTATLREVAELAGVSMGTASLALNDRPNVSDETRARVVEAALTLGYRKVFLTNQVEKSVAVIGMLVKHDYGAELSVNPFYSHVERGVESECRKRKIGLMYSAIEVDRQNRPVDWPAMVHEQRMDGLLMIGTFIEDSLDQIKARTNLPIVLIDSYAKNMLFDSVLIGNTLGASEAVSHLIELGHRHIGLTGSNPESPPSVLERRLGYQNALRKAGIEQEYIEDSGLTRIESFQATKRLLRRCPQITAIFSANDDSAIGTMNAAREMGLHIPEDLSVVGFDNIDIAREVAPALSTVHVPKPWLGIIGVRSLINRIQSPDQPRISIIVATNLIVRDTGGPPRQRSIDQTCAGLPQDVPQKEVLA